MPMASQKEYGEAGYLRAMNTRANTIRDSINYFPVEANQPCALGIFFRSDLASAVDFL